MEKLKTFVAKCKRVWLVLKKPTKNEFLTVTKISAAGILVLGALGFLIALVVQIFE